MKILKLRFEYKCFPIWLYGENNNLIDNELPDELIDDEINPLCVDLQEQFDSLYKDDGIKFEYIGFKNSAMKSDFIEKLVQLEQKLKDKIGKEYLIEKAAVHWLEV